MAIATTYEELPEDVKDDAIVIDDMLVHPYNTESRVWLAHCTNGGCGEYLDNTLTPPARDLMCDRCEAADVREE